MPVDLSRIGLEGIETAQRTLNSMAQREALTSQTVIAEAEEARAAEDREIDKWAAGALDSIGRGTGVPGDHGISLGEVDDDPAAVFNAIGERYLRAGAPKRGKEFIEGGIDLRKKIADTDKVRDDKEKVRLDNMFEAGSWVAQNIGENEAEYAVFLSQLEDPNNPVASIIGADNVAVLKNTPWSPELTNYFRSKALSIKDQASLALTERGHSRQETALNNTEAYRKQLIALNNANLEERRKEAARKAKADGPSVSSAPTGPERDSAYTAILQNVKIFNGVAPNKGTPERTALDSMTDDVASRAKQLVKENKGLLFNEAIEQAVGEAELAGDFAILEPAEEGFLGFGAKPAKTDYKRRGKDAKNPLPLPSSKAELIPGRYYKSADGTVEQYKP